MRKLGVILFAGFLVGCASSRQVPLLGGLSSEGVPLCLDDRKTAPAFVEKFYKTRDLSTEEGKIDYLIERVHNSKLVFIRNETAYDGSSAAEFLRWKLGRMKPRYHIEVKTAQDFVTQVASISRTSGQMYEVVFPDGSHHALQAILQNELDILESCLKQYHQSGESVTPSPPSTPLETVQTVYSEKSSQASSEPAGN